MATSISKTNGDLLAVLGLGAIDTQASPLTLIGEGAEDWIEAMNQNWVHSVENFANDLPPVNPLQGQFWFDQRDRSLNLWTGSEWIAVVPGSGTLTEDGFEVSDGSDEPSIPDDIAAAIEDARARAEALIAEAEVMLADRMALAETKLADAERFYIESDQRLSEAVEGFREIIGEYDPLYGTLGARVIEIADAQGDQATQIDAIQVVLGDETNGLRGEVATLKTTVATNSQVTSQRLDLVEAAIETGVGDVSASVISLANATATADQALSTRIDQTRSEFTANAVTTNARITSAQQTAASATLAVSQDLDVVEAALNTPDTGLLAKSLQHTSAISDLASSKATVDSVNALTAETRAKNKTYAQTTNPTNVPAGTLVVGDVLYRTDHNNKMFRWSGSAWVAVVDARPPTYVQTTAPTGAITGALWINTANNNVVSQFNGTSWTPYEDPRVPAATAKILTHDQVLADLPNNYAAASQFTAIKTEVEGARNGSGTLGAQLQSMRTATSDGLNLKASASDLNLLKAEVEGARNGSPNLSAQLLAMRTATSDGLALKATATEVNTLRTEISDARNGSPTLTAQLTSMRTATSDGLALKASASEFGQIKAEVEGARNGAANLNALLTSMRTATSDGLALKATATEVNTLRTELVDARNGKSNLTAELSSMRQATTDGLAGKAAATRVDSLEVAARSLPNLLKNGDFSRLTASGEVSDWGKDQPGTFTRYLHPTLGSIAYFMGAEYVYTANYNINAGDPLSLSFESDGGGGTAYAQIQWLPSFTNSQSVPFAGSWGFRSKLEGIYAPPGTTGYRIVFYRGATTQVHMARVKVNYGNYATNWSDEGTVFETNARISTTENVIVNLPANYAAASTFNSIKSEVEGARNGSGSLGAQLTSMRQTTTDGLAGKTDAVRTDRLEATATNALNRNADFSRGVVTGQIPANWNDWSSGSLNSLANGLVSSFGLRFNLAAGQDRGISQNVTSGSPGWHVVESTVTLEAGSFPGSGVLIQCFDSNGVEQSNAQLRFAEQPDSTGAVQGSGSVGRTYRYSLLFNAPVTVRQFNIYAMGGWSGFGSVAAKSIVFHEAKIRIATAAEIQVGVASVGTTLKARMDNTDTVILNLPANYAAASSFNSIKTEVEGARNGSGSLGSQLTSMRQTVTDGLNLKVDATEYNTLKAEITNARNGKPSVSALLADMRQATVDGDNASGLRLNTMEAATRSLPNLIKNSDFTNGLTRWERDGAGPASDIGTYYHATLGTIGWIKGAVGYIASDFYPINSGDAVSLSFEGDRGGGDGNASIQWLPGYAQAGHVAIPTTWGVRAKSENNVAPAGTTHFRVVIGKGTATQVHFTRVKANYGSVATNWSNEATAFDTNARIGEVESVTSNGTFATATRVNDLQATLQTRNNLCPNGSFENGLTGITGPAGLFVANNGWGPHAIAYNPGDQTHVVNFPKFDVFGSNYYTISGDTILFASSGHVAYLDLIFFDSAGNVCGDGPEKPIYSQHDFSNAPSRLQEHAIATLAPSNAVRAQARAVFGGTGINALGVRRVKVEMGGLPATQYTSEASDVQTTARVTQTESATATLNGRISATAGLTVQAGTQIAGMKIHASDGTDTPVSAIDFQAGVLRVWSPDQNTGIAPFEIRNGGVRMKSAFVDRLAVGTSITLGSGVPWKVAVQPLDLNVTDGQNVSFGFDLGNNPTLAFAGNNLAPLNAGETYSLYAENLSPTGFIARLKISTPATPANLGTGWLGANANGPTSHHMFIDQYGGRSTTGGYNVRVNGYNRIYRNRFNTPPNQPQPEYIYDDPSETLNGSTYITVFGWNGGAWVELDTIYIEPLYMSGTGYSDQYFDVSQSVPTGTNISHIGVAVTYKTYAESYVGSLAVDWQTQGSGGGLRSATPNGQVSSVTIRPRS